MDDIQKRIRVIIDVHTQYISKTYYIVASLLITCKYDYCVYFNFWAKEFNFFYFLIAHLLYDQVMYDAYLLVFQGKIVSNLGKNTSLLKTLKLHLMQHINIKSRLECLGPKKVQFITILRNFGKMQSNQCLLSAIIGC